MQDTGVIIPLSVNATSGAFYSRFGLPQFFTVTNPLTGYTESFKIPVEYYHLQVAAGELAEDGSPVKHHTKFASSTQLYFM